MKEILEVSNYLLKMKELMERADNRYSFLPPRGEQSEQTDEERDSLEMAYLHLESAWENLMFLFENGRISNEF